MQIQKNQILHGVSPWPPVGLGLSTLVVTGDMTPGGHLVQTGRGVVVVDVVMGEEGRGTPMTVVQSTMICVVVGANMVTTVAVVGHRKSMVVTPGHGSVTATAGVWKE
jgi:hypothetical protein